MSTLTDVLHLTEVAAPDNIMSGTALNGNATILDDLAGQLFNVRDAVYGAVGDGVTDDGPAIQAALDAAYAAATAAGAGAIVVIPPAKYLIGTATRLAIKTGVTLSAYGAYMLKQAGATTMGMLANFVGTETFSAYDGYSHIRVLGGIWDANAQNSGTDAAFDTMYFDHCTDILVKDVVYRNGCSYHGLEFNSCNGGMAINCRFEGWADKTTAQNRSLTEAIQIDCADAGSVTIPATDGTHAKNITIEGCYMGPASDGSGLGPYGKLTGSHASNASGHFQNIRVLNNVVDSSIDIGIGAFNWVDSIIANNVIRNSGSYGIQVTSKDPSSSYSVLGSGVMVIGNTIDTPTSTGIYVLGYTSTAGVADTIVAGNTILNSTGSGITAQLAAGTVIIDNIIDTPASNGISVFAMEGVVIEGNTIRHPGSNFCIFVGQVTSPSTVNSLDAKVSGNLCLLGTGATAGIRLSTGTSASLVSGNTVRKDGGSSAIAVSCIAGTGTTNTVTQNDFSGFGSNTSTITVSSGTINKTIASDANCGTNLI